MNINHQSDLSFDQKKIVIQLWNDEYPEKLNYSSITEFDSYLNNLHETAHYLLENKSGEV